MSLLLASHCVIRLQNKTLEAAPVVKIYDADSVLGLSNTTVEGEIKVQSLVIYLHFSATKFQIFLGS